MNAEVILNNGAPTTSGQSGQYSVPTGNASGIATIRAFRDVDGVTWRGSNRFALTAAGATVPNVQIVISNPDTQGTISGTVKNAGNIGISGAKVLVAAAAPSSAKFAFNTLGAIVAYTDGSGNFTIPEVPAATNYTLTASYVGQTNATAQGITVTAGQTITRNFTLATATGGDYGLPAVTNLDGLSITTPINPTRAAGAPAIDPGVLAVRDYFLQKRGFKLRHAADGGKIITKTVGPTRAAPSGYVIQNILEWDYRAYDALYGYAILRRIDNGQFSVAATIQDPLAERFSDGDGVLTPNTLNYYGVVRVDVNQNESVFNTQDPNNYVTLRPMDPITPTRPLNGSTQGNPLFQWLPVTNAQHYTVAVYDEYPQPANPTANLAKTEPIWSQEISSASTALAYQGPTLTSGRKYYWSVLADDRKQETTFNYDTTISALYNFIAP